MDRIKTYFEKELQKLWDEFKVYTKLVQNSFRGSIQSLEEGDKALAQKIIDSDSEIDQKEVEIEESCLKILALYQPVAKDLRYIIAILKINDELERIADLGCNIANRELQFVTKKPLELFQNLPLMVEIVEEMLEKSVDAIFAKDIDLAKKVIFLDDKIDGLHKENYKRAETLHQQGKCSIQDIFSLISVSRFIERAADHTTNIAENTIYFLTGEILRHKPLR
jgi:phosphate transport system protein